MKSNLLLILLGLTVALVTAEVLVRIFRLGDPETQTKTKPRSHIETSHRRQGKEVVVRDREGWDMQAANTTRILALGDSFTYGYLLKNSGSWPKQLEHEMRLRGYNVSVLNGARPGTDTAKQLALFKRSQSILRPDIVLLGFLINDCTTICSNCGPIELKRKIRRLSKKPAGFAKYSMLYRNVSIAFKRRQMTEQTRAMYLIPYEQESDTYLSCTRALADFKQLSDQEGFKFAVAIYPMLFELHDQHPFYSAHNKIAEFLRSIDVPVIDITPAFYGEVAEQLWIHPGDSHPTRRANSIAAKFLADFVAALLPRMEIKEKEASNEQ